MPRLRRTAATALLVVVAGTTGACDGGPAVPRAVTLAELVADHDRYDGETVVTEGVVRSYPDPLHYWIEDHELNRVELVPHELVEDLVGMRVEVRGRFGFEPDRGRAVEIEHLEVVGEVPRAAGATR